MYIVVVIIGLCIGTLSGLLGLGGGVLYVPALIYVLGTPIHKAVAISIAVVAPTAIVAFLKYASVGPIDYRSVLLLLPTAMLGSFVGASLSPSVPAHYLRVLFGVILLLVGINLIFVKHG